ncbi:MAG: heavy metal translocating P-type ATPase [Candidatus Hydrogenedentes bacterium]|nr:heavy metal translocating P-type ATPase [Candidatus Hydrogenedentota bacterium]
MTTLSFKVRGLDCAEEIAILKREVGPLAGGDENLAFDLLNGKLIVTSGAPGCSADAICSAVARTGMQAVPWDTHVAAATVKQSIWTRNARAGVCAISGATLAAGYLVHASAHGFLHAFAGADEPGHDLPWFSAVCYLAAMVSGGWFIAPKAAYSARRLLPDMNLLMTVAVIGALAINQWFEAATVAFLFAVALLLESWSVGRARNAIRALMDLAPAMARYRCPHDGDIEEKPVEDVPVGVTVLVRPGERVPLDGVLSKGATSINQASITGESQPIEKALGAEVFAGTINNEGAFEFTVTKPAADTTLARLIRRVEEAQSKRAPSEQWVERFARYYTPAMMALALLTAFAPPLLVHAAWKTWFYEGLVILVIACPCALVISTPVSIVAGLTAAARAGVLIKGGVYLEAAAHLRAIALDKTGTLTHGQPEVQEIVPLNGHTEHELLERAAALEAPSEHPLARAVLRRANAAGVIYTAAEMYQAVRGKGAEAFINGRDFWIGSHRLLHEKGGETPEVHDKALALEDAGHSVLVIGNDNHVCGLISVADKLRPHSAPAVQALRKAGIERITLLTGDNEGTGRAIAAASGVDDFQAELLPEDKVHAIEQLMRDYRHVAMVGDGVNDAPAMATATLGIAMAAAGSDAAIETADIALMSDDLSKLAWLIKHSRRVLRVIRQNIAFALGLKAAFITLALLGYATLWMAIAADMGASLLVIFNGLRLLSQHSETGRG